VAPRARFELATLRLTAEAVKNLSAASGVAYIRLGAILTFLVAPNPAPKLVPGRSTVFPAISGLESGAYLPPEMLGSTSRQCCSKGSCPSWSPAKLDVGTAIFPTIAEVFSCADDVGTSKHCLRGASGEIVLILERVLLPSLDPKKANPAFPPSDGLW
jgi:hypothetical protein